MNGRRVIGRETNHRRVRWAQDAVDPDAELIFIDALTIDIATVIDDTDSLHQ